MDQYYLQITPYLPLPRKRLADGARGGSRGGGVRWVRTNPPQGSKELLCSHYITFRER